MSQRQLIGLFGASLLIIGLFLPVIYVPYLGNVSYIRAFGIPESFILVVMTVVAIILILLKKFKFVVIPAGLITIKIITQIVSLTLVQSHSQLFTPSEIATNNYLKNSLATITQSIKPSFGYIILIAGTILLFSTAIKLKNSSK